MNLSKLKDSIMSYRNRLIIIVVGLVIGISSLLYTGRMARQLREKEQYEVTIWSYAMGRIGDFNPYDPLLKQIVNSQNNIPFIITDKNLRVRNAHLVPDRILNHPDLLRKKIDEFTRENVPLEINTRNGQTFYFFFGNSQLQRTLVYFPFIQITVVIVFIIFGFITFRSSKQDEQNRVWIGLAKETAHQLGTPISSLLGWVEYLRSQPVDQSAVEEMNNDLTRLMKVADRFSKIGSETILSPGNVNEIVGNSVMYFRTRIPKNVTLTYNGLAIAPVQAMLNAALFEWVTENLLKNALDALQGHGTIDVHISDNDNWVYIDFRDTGKGIAKANFTRIFDPGFTTKTRGWGLGLSLSKRIIEEYHNGRIYVVESELGKGSTIRIALKRYYA